MADKMGNPFQLLSSRLVGMWSFSRLENAAGSHDSVASRLVVLYHCTVSIYQFILYRLRR